MGEVAMTQYYRRLCVGLTDKGKLIPANDKLDHHVKVGNPFNDYYLSIYKYDEKQKQQFDSTGTIAGMVDLKVDKLVWDFDNQNPSLAIADAKVLVSKLLLRGFSNSDIRLFFSGSKGIHVQVDLDEDLTPSEFKAITKQLANGLDSYDPVVCNPSRILRGVGSVNLKSGLYKIPLSIEDLDSSLEEIQEKAKKFAPPKFEWTTATLPNKTKELKKIKEDIKPKVKVMDGLVDIDWSGKPSNMPACRYAISVGHFSAGERNSALMTYCAYLKNAKVVKTKAHYELKAAADLQSQHTGQEKFSKEEIWNKIVNVVYGDNWLGGQYTCRKPGWLQDYCESLGDKKCSHKTDVLVDMPQVYNLFKDYSQKYESNVLYTGIPELDKKMKLLAGTSNGILAPPGVGKTSLVLQILEHNSNSDVPCLFYSYDMFHSALYMRMLQRQSGMQQDDIYSAFLNDPESIRKHVEALEANFKNVKFCFKAGQTIDELESSILEAESKLGRKPKLVVVDYNELIMTGSEEDPTSSTAIVAQRLRQIANVHEVAVLTLLQPSKQFTSPSDEITNYNSIKGSSSTVQSLTLLLGCSRPGFDPLDSSKDKFFNITCLKNRNGGLFTQDLSWEGLTGRIQSLEDKDYQELKELREAKKAKKETSSGGW